jgi:hypothetical protein
MHLASMAFPFSLHTQIPYFSHYVTFYVLLQLCYSCVLLRLLVCYSFVLLRYSMLQYVTYSFISL